MKVHLMFLAAFPVTALAGQLTYQPINPAFGGSYLNGSYLLQNAGAQNSHTGPHRARTTTSTAERFARSLESRLTSQLLSDLSDVTTAQSGTLSTSEFDVFVDSDGNGGLSLTITEHASGEEIEIDVTGFQAPLPASN